MKFTVLWTPAAEQELARLWLAANDRPFISTAAQEIDRRLRNRPEEAGESRSQDRRILLVAPLGVVYRVEPNDAIVRVLKVWQFKTRK